MLRVFAAFQLLTPLGFAMMWPRDLERRAIVYGILGAQAALVGFWIALGSSKVRNRLLAVLPTLVWLTLVLLLLPYFNEWISVLLAFQLAVTAIVLVFSRRSSGCALSRKELEEEGLPWQFRIMHLMLLMVAVPIVWGVFPFLARSDILLYVHLSLYLYVLLVAVGFAATPLIACWAVFGRGRLRWRIPVAALATLLVTTAMAYHAYTQTGAPATARGWIVWVTTEFAFALLSFWCLKWIGFRVGRPAALASSEPETGQPPRRQ